MFEESNTEAIITDNIFNNNGESIRTHRDTLIENNIFNTGDGSSQSQVYVYIGNSKIINNTFNTNDNSSYFNTALYLSTWYIPYSI